MQLHLNLTPQLVHCQDSCLLLPVHRIRRSSPRLPLVVLGSLTFQDSKFLPQLLQVDLQHVTSVVPRKHPQALRFRCLLALGRQLQQRHPLDVAPVVHAVRELVQVLHPRTSDRTSHGHVVLAVPQLVRVLIHELLDPLLPVLRIIEVPPLHPGRRRHHVHLDVPKLRLLLFFVQPAAILAHEQLRVDPVAGIVFPPNSGRHVFLVVHVHCGYIVALDVHSLLLALLLPPLR